MPKETILIADDDHNLTKLLSSYLRAHRLDVALSFDAVQALMTAYRTPPDAMILDINMPGGTGVEVLKKLKASAKTASIPVIVMSASTDPQLPQNVRELGAEEFLRKPFDFAELYRTICRILGKPLEAPDEELLQQRSRQLPESPAAKKERRRNLRFRSRGRVWAEYSGQRYPLGNLSRGGAFVHMVDPPPVGTELELRLASPRLSEPIELAAVVRRSKAGSGMGVRFVQLHVVAASRLQDTLLNLCATCILIVDGDENIRWELTLLFNEQNYSVVTAADGLEGLQKAVQSLPDVITLDLNLPKLSGLEVCRRVRADTHLGQVAILVLSATSDQETLRAVQELGNIEFVPKPFDTQKLLEKVRTLVAP